MAAAKHIITSMRTELDVGSFERIRQLESELLQKDAELQVLHENLQKVCVTVIKHAINLFGIVSIQATREMEVLSNLNESLRLQSSRPTSAAIPQV